MNSKFDNLIRDIEEGIIVVDKTGTIMHINPKANIILHLKKNYESYKYASLIEDDTQNNDDFNQMIIEAVSEPNVVRKKRVKYKTASETKTLYITSSVLNDDNDNLEGVILSFDDITKLENLEKSGNDPAITFVFLIGILCFWIFVFSIWNKDQAMFDYTLFGKLIPLSALLATPVGMKVFGYSLADLWLNTKGMKKFIIQDSILTIAAVLLLCVIKIVVMKINPDFSFYCANNSFLTLQNLLFLII